MDLFDIAVAKKLAGGGGVTPTGNINITSTAQTDVSAYATAQVVDDDLVASNIKKDVDILGVVGTYEGGGGGGGNSLTLLATETLGEVSTTSTSETAIGKTITLSSRDDFNDYDILFVICSSNNQADGGHVATVAGGLLFGDSVYTHKNSASLPLETNNYKRVGDKIESRASSGTSIAGVYAKGALSGSTLTFTFYSKLNSTRTGTINGTYTAKVYGLNIYDLLNL